MLDAAAIVHEAEARAGAPDGEAALFHGNLQALVASINGEAGLSDAAAKQVHGSLVTRTADRIRAQTWLADHPEIGDERIEQPVFLTGLPRSGTTFFQYLFDRDERFRLIRTWEAGEPFPPPGFDPESVRRRADEEAERRRVIQSRVENFAAMHLSDADGPEECHAFLEQTYAAAGFHNLLDVPTFFHDHLLNAVNFVDVYRAHMRQLQLLQWRTPQPRWALKYPNHVLAMDAILEVHPEAGLVMTHRDPVQTLASIAKLTLALRRSTSAATVDPGVVGRQMFDFVQAHIDRILAFDATPAGARVVHVDYYRLVDDPATVLRGVHKGLGLDTPPPVESAVAEWHAQNPKGARGSNLYALEEFGLDPDDVAERFGDYMRRFDIPRESVGLGR